MFRSRVEYRHRGAQHVAHRISQPPPAALPGARVEDLAAQTLPLPRKIVDRVEVRRGVRVERCLGKEGNRIAEDVGEIEEARIPVVEAHAVHRARHSVLVQVGRHVDPQYVEPARHQRVYVARDRFRERRDEDARRKRRRLVMAVENHRIPFQLGSRHVARFQHVVHVAVAIVVMAHVFLVQIGQGRDLVRRAQILAIPRHHLFLSVRIQRGPQHQDYVVQNGVDIGIALRGDQFVGQQNGLLRSGDFRRMQAPVDVHDRFAFARQCVSRRVVEAAAAGQPLRDLLVAIQCGQVLRRGNNRDFPVQPARGLPYRDQLDAIARRSQTPEIVARFLVICQVEIVAGLVSQHRFRRGYRLRET